MLEPIVLNMKSSAAVQLQCKGSMLRDSTPVYFNYLPTYLYLYLYIPTYSCSTDYTFNRCCLFPLCAE